LRVFTLPLIHVQCFLAVKGKDMHHTQYERIAYRKSAHNNDFVTLR